MAHHSDTDGGSCTGPWDDVLVGYVSDGVPIIHTKKDMRDHMMNCFQDWVHDNHPESSEALEIWLVTKFSE